MRALTVAFPSTACAVLDEFLRDSQTDPRVTCRARAVRAVAAGSRRRAAANAQGLSTSSLDRWIRRFAREGVIGLFDQPRSGRPFKLMPDQEARLIRLASEAPAQYGIEQSQWSSSTLSAEFSRQTGLQLHKETVRRILLRSSKTKGA